MADIPETSYARSNGADIAYQDFGEGPTTIVAVPPMAQNIDLAWEWPEVRAMLERFASFCRYVCFDKRGTGMSTRTYEVPGIDERVDDMRAVMDAAGVGRAHLFGVSEGAPMSLLFAATYPDRVASVVIESGAARLGATAPPPPAGLDLTAPLTELGERFVAAWGTPETMTPALFAPSLADDPAFVRWHGRYERHSATPSDVRALIHLNRTMDVRDVLDRVRVPVLAIRRADDPHIPDEAMQETVDLLADARRFTQPGTDHFTYAADWMTELGEIERFTTGSITVWEPPRTRRVEIRTLGLFEVVVDGEVVEIGTWGSKRARTLCKRLVAAGGWPVTRDELFELLWPDETDAARLAPRLSVQLSHVRRVLDGGVVADRSTVRLDLDHVTTDVATVRGGDDDTVIAAYTGEFLPGDRFDDWTQPIRDELRSRFVAAAHRRIEALTGTDDEAVVELALRIADEDPYDLTAIGAIGDAHERLGRHGQAEAARSRLAEVEAELGL